QPQGPIEPPSPVPTGPVVEATEAPAAPETPPHLGRFVSDTSEKQVLLQWNPASASFSRVPPQGILPAGQDLLALPDFRPLIALTDGMIVQLRDGTRLGLEAVPEQDIPKLILRYGQIVVSRVGKSETRLRLDTGAQSGSLVFVDPESRAAVEMFRMSPLGVDPEKEPAPPVVNVYSLNGRLAWEPADGSPAIEFKPRSRLTIGPDGVGPAAPIEEFPKWYLAGAVSSLDRGAARAIEEAVPVDRPVSLGLKESLDHRKKEVRWLATRCLGYLGEFGPMVAVLDDPEQKLAWTDYLDQLHESLARGPETAAQVRQAFEKSHPAEGAGLYRMLWGYTPAQLVDGQDAVLVESLASEILAVRVLAFWNLNRITGLGLYFRPEDPPSKRQSAVRTWEKRQTKGEIRMKAAAFAEPAARKSEPRP
ncbi:MAG TPA: hypothetical protein VJL29_04415, partial [Thermoguttaceae bacterium]|nr:hypothetical protein [Thermoguttaceae bacterium]